MKKNKKNTSKLNKLARNNNVQRMFLVLITVLIAFIIIETGAQPTKYKLSVGDVSRYDIPAPRDIVNEVLTEQNRLAAMENVEPVTKEDTKAFVEVIYKKDDFFKAVAGARSSVEKYLKDMGISSRDENYAQYLKDAQNIAINSLSGQVKKQGIILSQDQISYLVTKATDSEMEIFEELTRRLISESMAEEVTESNLAIHLHRLQNSYQSEQGISQELKNIGEHLVRSILKPNRIVDADATAKKKEEAYNDNANIVKIKKESRIISFGDIVTDDKLKLLEDLNLLEKNGKYDYLFSAGILFVILFLTTLTALFLRKYNKDIYNRRKDILLICLIITIILVLARYLFTFYDGLVIPIFMGTMLVATLLNIETAVVINCILTIGISVMSKGNLKFLYLGLICGVISAFMVSKANQRSRMSMNGLLLGLINTAFIVCLDFIYKSDSKTILIDSAVVFLNGFVSMILTIGFLPFLESAFNIVTPLKLLELSNPNHPLLKKLLIEAPGTYHHSLMVGNLAEIAAEDLGANALLARTGAYFHDVGKLKRPDFFKENQLTENPHDRMTPNLSTLVITSHTKDGLDIAAKYKLPQSILDIIKQHHGTTLVAYFYHKALKGEGEAEIKQEDYRYDGPKPQTREAAVVMLADSVEAAVRSMNDKTEAKIEALIRKIIKDKLDDGQLDNCQLTLNDLDKIANSFMRVLSGYFHAREQYPEIKDALMGANNVNNKEINELSEAAGTDAIGRPAGADGENRGKGEARVDNNRK
ncbi:HD family phosphohydrolase [Ruminiclostridium cellobioparum]|uniref:Putative domain HDIG n=1 Tax=Ruminiclostridium cellobioparum subsp. termitidis CT1112 TaxID=1195236 RepID=S0FPC8_RUMCE|nr:HDIG domain-containing metalloprotein [Ruminiclostridium cellobioparum]EMS72216.1 putative domain HDIG [Ruminiclostridium cellobioparum subsp. termitidis CT1112]